VLLSDRNRQRLNQKGDDKEMAACVPRALLTQKSKTKVARRTKKQNKNPEMIHCRWTL
jgi:hypothetical protein